MRKIILFLLMISIFLLIGCEDFSKIKKNQLMIDKINKEEKEINAIKVKNITEEEIKEKALKAFKKYYDIEINESDFSYSIRYITSNKVNEYLEEMNMEKYLQIKMDYNDVLKNGYYSVMWYSDRKSKAFKKGNYSMYAAEIDGETKEILNMTYYGSEKEKNNQIPLSQAKKIAENFIKEKKLLRSDRIKFVNVSNEKIYEDSIVYYLLYEDKEESKNKVFIGVRKDTKKIENFSIGVKAMIDYMERDSDE